MKTRVNQPAYPTPLHLEDAAGEPMGEEHAPGLTKREAFALAVLQGLCANEQLWVEIKQGFKEDVGAHGQILAQMAVERADALITALNNNKPKQEVL